MWRVEATAIYTHCSNGEANKQDLDFDLSPGCSSLKHNSDFCLWVLIWNWTRLWCYSMAIGRLILLISLQAIEGVICACPHEGSLNRWSANSTWGTNGKVCCLLFWFSTYTTFDFKEGVVMGIYDTILSTILISLRTVHICKHQLGRGP